MDIETDGCCGQHDHQLVVLNVTKFPLAVQVQNEYGCMICQTKTDEYYFDKKCRVRLCTACFSYCQRTTGDKTRSIIVKCSMKHVLTYIAGSDDIIDRCSECKQQKIIKLRCYYCEEEVDGVTKKLNYCFECKPIKLDTCYYKHRLKLAKF